MSSTMSEGTLQQGPSRHPVARIGAVLGDIKIAHTVFALPFALLSAHLAFVGTGGYRLNTILAILLCMFTARTAAMSFNRWLDRDIDASNPRTLDRAIPSGRARPADALGVVIACSIVFVATCWYLGRLPFALSLPTIAFILTYSWSKRFTALTHLWLGSALAIAPTGAWIAVTGGWSWLPVILSIGVVFWVAGFDVIYSLQDIEFDRLKGIHSIPAMVGEQRGLWIARGMHVLSFFAFVAFGRAAMMSFAAWPYWTAIGIVGALLIVEHAVARPGDRARLGIAFFTLNGVISILLYASVIVSTMLTRTPGK